MSGEAENFLFSFQNEISGNVSLKNPFRSTFASVRARFRAKRAGRTPAELGRIPSVGRVSRNNGGRGTAGFPALMGDQRDVNRICQEFSKPEKCWSTNEAKKIYISLVSTKCFMGMRDVRRAN